MSLPSIQTNLAAMINKAYSADNSAATATASTAAAKSTEKEPALAKTAKDENPASSSAQVTLGQSGNTTEIYTAQGLLQQMRQIQLSNSMLLFGHNAEDNEDSNGLLGMMSGGAEGDSSNENWTDTISKNPEQAAVMIEKAKNASIKTMLGN
ncbi:MAG: hypothetical protein ACTS9Y_12445 [Methylophilus sp.]|uniref:hypothetical protein n=1 Tax=Methylophilus sp. TaxID=29541 RepID=UPI003F9F39AB